ncbi:MAG: hypothetical protein AB7Q16_24150 [Vicinamibacterales bacterium]
MSRDRRHRWHKLRDHVYICQTCGTGKVNAQDAGGQWFTTWHTPDGRSVVSRHAPRCERGPRTAKYLAAKGLGHLVPSGAAPVSDQPCTHERNPR